jgi:hypothetical protein
LLIAATLLVAQTLVSSPQQSLRVTVRSELPIARRSETIEVSAAQLAPLGDLTRVHVFQQGRELLAQTIDLDADGAPESLVFQADFPPRGELAFDLRAGEKRVYAKDDFRVYGRFVRERFDDFAWENDRVAHRMYGAALETWQKEPLTSSAVDVWLKRTRRLVINDWYMADDYHRDHGEGADFYSAGRSRGCGGSGLWQQGRLVVSRNFRDSKVLAAGPVRLVFELRYPDFETKRVTLDAGQNFNRFDSRYDAATRHPEPAHRGEGSTPLRSFAVCAAQDDGGGCYAAGIKKNAAGTLRIERDGGWMRTWEPVAGGAGQFGCALVLDPAMIVDVTEAEGNHLVVARGPASYWVGSGWDRSGDFAGVADWDRTVAEWAQRVRSPLRVEVQK